MRGTPKIPVGTGSVDKNMRQRLGANYSGEAAGRHGHRGPVLGLEGGISRQSRTFFIVLLCGALAELPPPRSQVLF